MRTWARVILAALGPACFACGGGAAGAVADAPVDAAAPRDAAAGTDAPPRADAGDATDATAAADAAGATDAAGAPDASPECPAWTGDVQWGTPLDDEAIALLALPDGVVAAGFQGGDLGVENDGPVGNGSGWVRRVSTSGARSWDAIFDSSDMDTVEALAWDPAAGRVFAVGRTLGALDGPNQGQWDAFVGGLDPASGAHTSLFQFGDERPQHPASASIAGGALLIGGYDDTYVLGNAVEDFENPFVAAVGGGGTSVLYWTKDRTRSSDFALGVLAQEDGSAWLGGTRGASPPTGGAWLRSVGPAGDTAWEANVSTFSLDSVAAILPAPDGLLRVVGTRIDGSTSQPFVAAFDTTARRVVWIQTFDPPVAGASYVYAAAAFGDGSLALAGTTDGSFDAARANAGGSDAFALRVGPDGALQGAWQSGSAAEDRAQAVAVDACGRVFVAGITSGALVGPSAGREDAFLMLADLH